MTTIAYDHTRNEIAVDGRYTENNLITTDAGLKYRELESGIVFLEGSVCDFDLFAEMLNNCGHGDEIEGTLDCTGFLVRDGKVCRALLFDGVLCLDGLDSSYATGSGKELAIAALDHGKTAKQAVQYAATRDCFTGGKVSVYDIKRGRFK